MDLNIIQAADMDTDMGSVKSVSYTGLKGLFLYARRARESVITKVIGTFTAAIMRVWARAEGKSFLEYVYLKFSRPAKPFTTPFAFTLENAFTIVLIKG